MEIEDGICHPDPGQLGVLVRGLWDLLAIAQGMDREIWARLRQTQGLHEAPKVVIGKRFRRFDDDRPDFSPRRSMPISSLLLIASRFEFSYPTSAMAEMEGWVGREKLRR